MARMSLALSCLLLAVAATNANVVPQADCTWSINTGLPTNQALYIKPDGSKDLRGFWLPQSGDIVSVAAGETTIFACPGGTLGSLGVSDALMTCIGGSSWQAPDGRTFSFSSLGCSRDPFHDAVRTSRSCNIPGDTNSLFEIGFRLSNGDFYVVVETCLNDATGDSLYSVHLQTPEIGGYQSGYPRPGFVQGPWYEAGLDVDYQYSRTGQLAAVTQAVGSASLAGQYIQASGDYFLSRGHMTAKADFVYGAHQRATFWFLNVAPQWQTVNGGNWNNLEMSTRAFADKYANDLIVYTGTHGTTTLADINGNQVPIHIAYSDIDGSGLLRVPEFYWRVVYDPTTGLGTAFVGHNNPYVNNPGPEFYLCPDVCSQVSWINWQQNNQALGYSYCCEVGALSQFVEEIPPMTVTGLLT